MINLDKLTILETHIPGQFVTEFKGRIQVHASCKVSDEAMSSNRNETAAKVRDDVCRRIWDQIYGGELRDQANRIHREVLLIASPQITEKLRVEIGRLFNLINYKP